MTDDAIPTLDDYDLLQERLVELELALEDQGWQSLADTDREFSRQALTTINRWARLYWLKNPLVKRGIYTQTCYVFGQGVTVKAAHPAIDAVVQAFLADEQNKAEFTDHQARMQKETELQLFANLFFVFFVNAATGRVRIRTIGMHEIEDVLCNPEDAKEPWYYKRVWLEVPVDAVQGPKPAERKAAYYPDWRYRPSQHPPSIGGIEVRADTPIYHVAVNRLSDMKFGVSEVYAGLDWARAYKEFLENWATIVKAYARFAMQLTTKGGKKGVVAAKSKLASTLATSGGSSSETNPAATTASTFIATEGITMQPVRTAGATTSADDGRRLMLMYCSTSGIFEHYLTGDPSTGNLATAKAMERPMELMFRDRQELWRNVIHGILQYVVDCSVRAEKGPIRGTVVRDEWTGDETITLAPDTGNEDETKQGLPMDRTIAVTFPPLLEHDAVQQVAAIQAAATLGGVAQAKTLPKMLVSRLLLQALGVEDIDAVLDELYPEGEPDPEDTPPVDDDDDEDAPRYYERKFLEAMVQLRDAMRGIPGAA